MDPLVLEFRDCVSWCRATACSFLETNINAIMTASPNFGLTTWRRSWPTVNRQNGKLQVKTKQTSSTIKRLRTWCQRSTSSATRQPHRPSQPLVSVPFPFPLSLSFRPERHGDLVPTTINCAERKDPAEPSLTCSHTQSFPCIPPPPHLLPPIPSFPTTTTPPH